MSAPRLLAIDLDGTSVRPDGAVAPAVRAGLDDVREAGIDVAIATGRPPRFTRTVARMLGCDDEIVCANGAVTYHVGRDAVVESVAIGDVGAVVAQLREAAPGVALAAEWGLEHAMEEAFHAALPFRPRAAPVVADLVELRDTEIHKLLAVHTEMAGPELWAACEIALGGLAEPSHSGFDFVEIAPDGVTKATGLEALCARRGISAEEVVAVGDNLNDVPMLRWAGRSVVAGDVAPEIAAVADETVASNADDGVAELCRRLLAEVRA